MNQLHHSTSLYLKQHENNPVAWRIWGRAALDEAKAKGLPILLSSGYAACHWCHVMAEESFENEGIARIINANFIPIKIDREERPEIDALYMDALHALGVAGGWPLTMFLDEEGAPFWGGTYFPNPERGGMVGFSEVLLNVVRLWQEERASMIKNRDALREVVQSKLTRARGGTLSADVVPRMAAQLGENFDDKFGGLGSAPKFPNLPIVDFLWQVGLEESNSGLTSAVEKTLSAICLGGIYDHIGGGVARYSVDERWHIPHFEKMLYDNGLLLWSLSEVYRETQNPLLKYRAGEIVSFLEREMVVGEGLAASLDADSYNAAGRKEEGAYYVWQEKEIDGLLSGTLSAERLSDFKQAYGIKADGNWIEEKTNVLFLENFTENWEKELQILFLARQKRKPPARDEKIIAAWNGIAINALAHAGWVFGEKKYLAFAESLFQKVEGALVKNNRLCHSICAGQVIEPCLLSDIAFVARAAWTLYLRTQKENYLARVENYLQQAEKYFTAAGGGFYLSAKDADDIPLGEQGRILSAADDVMPSANSILWQVTQELLLFKSNAIARKGAQSIEQGFAADVTKGFSAHTTWLATLRREQKNLSIVLICADTDENCVLEHALQRLSLAAPVIKVKTTSANALNKGHAAFGKTAVNEKPTAYICLASRCLPPITDEEELIKVLRAQRAFNL